MSRTMGYCTPERAYSGRTVLVPMPAEIVRELVELRPEDIDRQLVVGILQDACKSTFTNAYEVRS